MACQPIDFSQSAQVGPKTFRAPLNSVGSQLRHLIRLFVLHRCSLSEDVGFKCSATGCWRPPTLNKPYTEVVMRAKCSNFDPSLDDRLYAGVSSCR